jgi:hypothetical protein
MAYFPRSSVTAASSELLTMMQPPDIPGFTGGAAPGLSVLHDPGCGKTVL